MSARTFVTLEAALSWISIEYNRLVAIHENAVMDARDAHAQPVRVSRDWPTDVQAGGERVGSALRPDRSCSCEWERDDQLHIFLGTEFLQDGVEGLAPRSRTVAPSILLSSLR